MWTSVYMTQNIETAKEVRLKIEAHSISVMLHKIAGTDGNADCYELLVPFAELSEALDIIID